MLIGANIMHKTLPLGSAQQGAVLLEAMIAILIFSMGVLAIVGLQAAMIKNTADSKYRAEAGFIAQQELGKLWANGPDPVSLKNFVPPNSDISTLLPSGTLTVVQPTVGQFVVTVTWQQPGSGETQHTFTTTARIADGG
jgi:type IV pilus assembly protein PilV